MNKPLVIQQFVPSKKSTTADSQLGVGSSTAVLYNLAAIMKNNVVIFEVPTSFLPGTADTPMENDAEQTEG